MILRPTILAGAFVVEPEPIKDTRGFFARTFCQREFESAGLDGRVAQCSVSYNPERGTLRGLHYQAPPHEESKLVRCTQGAIYDVIVDLRVQSPTFRQWFGVELTSENRLGLFIPKGVAHGFQTLTSGAEVLYQISPEYQPGAARGVRWNDLAFGISWPEAQRTISERDRSYPDFSV
jgi:dTDP-4-dehydrorhamnose 3,5-epimerase